MSSTMKNLKHLTETERGRSYLLMTALFAFAVFFILYLFFS